MRNFHQLVTDIVREKILIGHSTNFKSVTLLETRKLDSEVFLVAKVPTYSIMKIWQDSTSMSKKRKNL